MQRQILSPEGYIELYHTMNVPEEVMLDEDEPDNWPSLEELYIKEIPESSPIHYSQG